MSGNIQNLETLAPGSSVLAQDDRQWLENNFSLLASLLSFTSRFLVESLPTPEMKVYVHAGTLPLSNSFLVRAAQTSATITKPTTNPRLDLVVVDKTTGDVSIVSGTENAAPVEPALPNGKNKVAVIHLSPNMSAITNDAIVQVREQLLVG